MWPTGIGVLYGRAEILDSMPPWHGGGEMIVSVTLEKSTFKKAPHRFEAGTPNIAGAIGLAAAIDYIERSGAQQFSSTIRSLLVMQLNVWPSYRECASSVQRKSGARLSGLSWRRASARSDDVCGSVWAWRCAAGIIAISH